MPIPGLTDVQRVMAIVAGKRSEYAAAVVGGIASAFNLVALGANGRLDLTTMPEGIGPNTDLVTFTEAVPAGGLVNVYNSGTDAAPVFSARRADGSTTGKEAHGFVLAAVASGGQGTVYGSGENTAVAGLKPGSYFLSGTTPGGISQTPASGAGTTFQDVGTATSAGVLMFRRGEAWTRA